MKLFAAFCVVAGLFLTSCGEDKVGKAIEDQIAYIEDLTGVLEEVADGGDATLGAEKIRALGKRGKEMLAHKVRLYEETDSGKLEAAQARHEEALNKAKRAQLEAIRRLDSSGRLTPELTKAIENLSAGN